MAQLQRLAIAPAQIQDQQIALTSQQHHYLSHVLRLREGDRFIAMDGLGQSWLVTLADRKAQILEPLSIQTELPITVTLMVALPKGNGFDEVVRSCTALGVTCFAPVVSDRTLLNPSPQKLQRWRRIAQEAAEQSERQIVPTILDPVPFPTGLSSVTRQETIVEQQAIKDKNLSAADLGLYICLARGNSPHLLECLQNKRKMDIRLLAEVEETLLFPPASLPLSQSHQKSDNFCNRSIVIATGPEGGFSPIEEDQAIAAGFKPVSLGSRILTAVLAPIVALSLATAVFEIPKSKI